jgi:hypothetical protein
MCARHIKTLPDLGQWMVTLKPKKHLFEAYCVAAGADRKITAQHGDTREIVPGTEFSL